MIINRVSNQANLTRRAAPAIACLTLALAAAGCGAVDMHSPDAGSPDVGTADMGTPDLGTPDAGTPDLGAPDAGTPDVGTPDAGTPDVGTPDAGTPDVGTVDAGPPRPLRLLDAREPHWIPLARERINQMIANRGIASPGYDPMNRPVAAMDWDNTMMKNDIGDATFFWMLAHDRVLQPDARDWSNTSSQLTPAARSALNTACDGLALPHQPLPTSTPAGLACANEIYSIYGGTTVPRGTPAVSAPAWTANGTGITLTDNAAYTWVAQLTAGYSPAEVRSFARAAYDQDSHTDEGVTRPIGSFAATAWVRIYTQMNDLVRTLQVNGFDVWVVSASPQFFVEAVAAEVNVMPDRVIGIRSTVGLDGLVTSGTQQCGNDPAVRVTTFDQGKRCWINQIIFHEPAATQLTRLAPARRVAFAAGDSDTDIAFVQDATDLKLAINRGKTQLMCNAYSNYMMHWIVQPMFIQPRSCRATAFPCSTAHDTTGALLVDEGGAAMTDQMDSVCVLPP